MSSVLGTQSVSWSLDITHGAELPPVGDPLEDYHVASSLTPATAMAAAGPAGMLYSSDFDPVVRLGLPVYPPAGADVGLPPSAAVSPALADAIHNRRSRTELSAGPVPFEQLAALLRLSHGLCREQSPGSTRHGLRVVPSGGAMYPLDLYVHAASVPGLQKGCYHFDPFADRLRRMTCAPTPDELAETAVMPNLVTTAAAIVLVTATIWRSPAKYGQRSYRYAHIEAGHVAQNLLLVATHLGLQSTPWAGFYDRLLAEALDLDSVNQFVVYAVSLATDVEPVS